MNMPATASKGSSASKFDPYHPPQVASPAPAQATPFFATGLPKLAVLYFGTLGLYSIFWFHVNWSLIRRRTGRRLSPVWRSIFSFIFCFAFFQRVAEHPAAPATMKLQALLMAALFILSSLAYKLPNPYSIVCLFSLVPILVVQRAINRINCTETPGHDPNSRLTGWNWLAVAIGWPLFILGVIGWVYFPDA